MLDSINFFVQNKDFTVEDLKEKEKLLRIKRHRLVERGMPDKEYLNHLGLLISQINLAIAVREAIGQ